MTDLDLSDLGLAASQTSPMSSEHASLVAATFDDELDSSRPLPLLWHWCFFPASTPTSALGDDGHPRREGALLTDFPRRMWVGSDVTGNGDLQLDVHATRHTRLIHQKRKQGSSGELLFVTLEHVVEQDGATIVVERQDVVYRGAGGTTPAPGPAVPPPTVGDWTVTVVPTTALLFRFSAVTFNSHRIHYDQEYTAHVEGYPGLVVHAPLTAMLLGRTAADIVGRPLRTFNFHATSPLFVNHPLHLTGTVRSSSANAVVDMTAVRSDGAVAVTASMTAE